MERTPIPMGHTIHHLDIVLPEEIRVDHLECAEWQHGMEGEVSPDLMRVAWALASPETHDLATALLVVEDMRGKASGSYAEAAARLGDHLRAVMATRSD